MINRTEKGILAIFFIDIVHRLTYAGNLILFQIKVNARNIKETTLARYFIKVTARPSFTRLRDAFYINLTLPADGCNFGITFRRSLSINGNTSW